MDAIDFVLDPVLDRCAQGDDGFECIPQSIPQGDGHRLKLWGNLPAGWAGNLALHAYTARLAIVSGDAVRTRSGSWAASFLLRTSSPTTHLGHDFLNMARRGPRLVPELPQPVVSIAAQLSHDSPGTVYSQVAGKDSVGLVAEILRRFAAFGLQPRRFMLRTKGEEVEDWFWLEPLDPPY